MCIIEKCYVGFHRNSSERKRLQIPTPTTDLDPNPDPDHQRAPDNVGNPHERKRLQIR